jgi:hypothetical protein
MFTVHFTLTVNSPLQDNELVFVTGSHPELGEWFPNRALRLAKNEQGQWIGSVSLGVETVKFRYFTGYFLHSEDNSPTLIISKWETHLLPRYVMPAVEASKTRVCRANVNDVFGFNGGKEMLSDGWLLNDDHNQILLLVTEKALKFYKPRHVREEYRLKIVPLDLRNKSDGHDEDLEEAVEEETLPSQHYHSCSHTEIAVKKQWTFTIMPVFSFYMCLTRVTYVLSLFPLISNRILNQQLRV